MAHVMSVDTFRGGYFRLLHETFERSQVIYPDPDTSLFDTLQPIPLAMASRQSRCMPR
jgi:hypothetical protein